MQKVLQFITVWIALGAIGVLAVSAIYTPENLPNLPLCSFKQMTGRPCPGCGLTRAFCAISHARFGEALYFNPFSYALYAGALGLALWPLASHCYPRLKSWVDRTTFFVWVVPITLAAMLGYGIFRMFFGPNI